MSTPMEQTQINPKWLWKMVIIALFLIGFGAWGLYDATIAYPKRGINYAEYAEWEYLRTIKQADSAWDRAAVKDPSAELKRLDERLKAKSNVSAIEKTRHEWLGALDTIGRLQPAQTDMADPVKRFEDLNTRWTTTTGTSKSSPKKLAGWDIPVQWLITVLGFGLGLYLVGLILIVKRVVYRWEPASQRLTLPGGASLTPADIAEFDKRKWHKYLIYLKVRPGVPQVGGQELRLDLLRYAGLEDWVLAMEKTAFPENQPAAEPPPIDPAPVQTPA